jgi:hypothetical protein
MTDSDSNDGYDGPMGPGDDFGMGPEPQPEEHLWLAKLSKANNVIKFEGCDDAESNLCLKRATLDGDCEDEARHVIEIISLDHEDKRISGTLCSLSLKNNCSVSLDSLTISPPTAFKLIKGSGPITVSGNLMKEIDINLLDEEDEEAALNGIAEEEEVGSDDNEAKIEEMADEESSCEEEPEKENKKPNQNKRKNQEKSPESNKKQKTDSANNNQSIKAKIENNKDSKSGKAPITNAKELIDAIKSSKGGRPSKKGKFDNWVRNQFKVENKDWVEKAWKAMSEAK